MSDPKERAWYDEHRASILKGWTAQGQGGHTTDAEEDLIFDVEDYQHASCFFGYDDKTEDNFYQVYTFVFTQIAEGEIYACPDTSLKELEAMFPVNFGTSKSDYISVVSPFYAAWDNFSTRLTFAWEDKYDTRDAEHRRIRKAMEGENKKHRKTAKRERNEEILKLVAFVKKMDPRVKAYKDQLEIEKKRKKEQEKLDAERRKIENKLAKEKWLEERQKEIEETEMELSRDSNNRGRFMFRLADEEDDERRKKKGKKKKPKKGKNKSRWDSSDDERGTTKRVTSKPILEDDGMNDGASDLDPEMGTETNGNEPLILKKENAGIGDISKNDDEEMESPQTIDDDIEAEIDANMIYYSSEDDESEEEPDVWKCEICRKEFKSEKQLENHLKSKKHKDAVKKYEKKNGRQKKATKSKAQVTEKDALEDLMNELDEL